MNPSKRLLLTTTLALAAALTGCASESSVGLVIPAANRATARVQGSNPFVSVRNDGPGTVVVRFTPHAWPAGEPITLVRGSTGQTMRDGGEIVISNNSDKRSIVHITAKNATGLSAEQTVQPATPAQ